MIKAGLFRILAAVLVFGAIASGLAQQQERTYEPVTDEMLLNPDPAEWLNWRGTLDLHGYSELDQINRETVGDLELAWAFPMPTGGMQEISPLVHDGIMYWASNDNIVQAVDAATGELIWEYRHVLPEFEGGYHNYQRMRQKNSVALYDDSVILSTVDAKLMSLDALTGQVEWEVQVHDWEAGYSYTAGPVVYDGVIYAGISGCSMTGTAGGCYITAHDVETGEEIWRVNTLADPQNEEVDASWNGLPVESRWGATPWTTGSVDPELGLTYWGTGMPIPYPEIIRGSGDGDALYTNSTLALDMETGEIAWYFQHLPRDNWDLDSPFERVLIDTEIDGEERSLLVTIPGKSSIAFALDRETGEFIWARDTIYQNVVTEIDPETGEVTLNEELIPTEVGQEVMVCPSLSGGKLWQAVSYSPLTNAMYAPLAETCNTVSPSPSEFLPGEAVGATSIGPRVLPPNQEEAGAIFAIDVTTGEHLWVHRQRPIFSGSVLTTAGGLLFAGDAARFLKAFDQETGEVLWETRLNSPIGGYMMTYEIDGEQYLAVPTGEVAQASSAASLFPEFPLVSGSNSLFVFKLPNDTGESAAAKE